MRYLKTYENYKPTDYDINVSIMKKLLSHITKLFDDLGFDYKNYIDGHKYEVEFDDKNSDYIFYISMKIDTFQMKNIILELKKSLAHKNNIISILPEYLENINGINKMSYDDKYSYTYGIRIKDVDKVINQINLESLEYYITVNKYNL